MASVDWECTICNQIDCIHLNPNFTPSKSSKYDMMPEPSIHAQIPVSDLVLIVSVDKSAFHVQKNKLPVGSILETHSKNWSKDDSCAKIKIPFSKGVLKLLWHYFYINIGKEIQYKNEGYWIDVLSEKNIENILPIIQQDWENLCYEQQFQQQFVQNILPNTFGDVDPTAISTQPILPKINGKYYPTRMFVRILAEYLIFPLRLEKCKITSYVEDYKMAQKMHQAYSRN
ncbi:hypothetical protein H012_gp270 [Acanthamoeba polyphaga moumouvirus]|uniref:Uncharacterized protein n=1 Tax=Acanthamoeba polyphaga moumouvirus TaxID=1269028 RepID=L7RC96_9VIRU|nr:hypothetical protein H012_gp270 [Acanthamoeba polyphaga moumouvirus]AGC02184.1 hypothetical protein Moumou_00660 [Acanthamoeba polyphaga moumouvirus]